MKSENPYQLREKDVLIIGSGGTVHNLRAVGWEKDGKENDQWALILISGLKTI